MKKIELVLICVILGLVSGCKKKPVESEPVQAPPAVVSVSEVATAAKPETVPATPVQPQAKTETLLLTAKSETVPAVVSQPVSTERLAWMTDFEAAQKKAAAEGKDLFIDFTGSDWCGWCMRLDKEVFSQKLFIYEAQKRFVFVYVDFPRNKKQSDALKTQNEKLAQRYQAQTYPTIILALADGRPYAQTGYLEGGPLAYLQELAKLRLQRPAK